MASKTAVSYLVHQYDQPVAAGTHGLYPRPSGGTRKPRPRKYICETCGFGFCTKSDLQKHVTSVHLQLKPYSCTVCHKRFGEKSNATKHMRSVHERQRNAQCGQCGAVFAFRDGLARHIKLVHNGVRNYRCTVPGCNDAFKQSAHLKKHLQSIHGVVPAPHQ